MTHQKTKTAERLAIICLCALLLFCVLPVHGEDRLYEKVLRLHVIANSDSDLDQSLKLKVRDAVLDFTAPLLAEASTREEAAEIISKNKVGIERAAEATLGSLGHPAPVSLEVCFEHYPTKSYESFCFPAGEYLSVKLKIGEAAGQNWWCVLFPSLCTKISYADESVAVGFTPEQYRIITENGSGAYKIRFKLLEFFEELGE